MTPQITTLDIICLHKTRHVVYNYKYLSIKKDILHSLILGVQGELIPLNYHIFNY